VSILPELPRNWQSIPVRYLSECLDGKRVPLNIDERSSRKGEFPYWGANGVVDYVDDYLFYEKLVLVGEDGAPFFDKDKPVAFVVEDKVWVNNHIHVLRIKPEHEARYITHCLNATDYGPWIEGSTRDKLTQDKLNSILHSYRQYIVGRMGIPYPKRDVAIISVVIDAPNDVISGLSGKLGLLEGINVKTVYSKRK